VTKKKKGYVLLSKDGTFLVNGNNGGINMGEHSDLINEYWEEFDELTKEQKLSYIWSCWGELLADVVRDWEEETLKESIQELREIKEAEK
jgi:hypothetical protein